MNKIISSSLSALVCAAELRSLTDLSIRRVLERSYSSKLYVYNQCFVFVCM